MLFISQHSLRHLWRRRISELKQLACVLSSSHGSIVPKDGNHLRVLLEGEGVVFVLDEHVARDCALEQSWPGLWDTSFDLFVGQREVLHANAWGGEVVVLADEVPSSEDSIEISKSKVYSEKRQTCLSKVFAPETTHRHNHVETSIRTFKIMLSIPIKKHEPVKLQLRLEDAVHQLAVLTSIALTESTNGQR
ncbi:hypothetical protein HG530_010544 [Fusarium avenaceum]|nr:hypothetical protein HG530_010544 [Fusarium avenaceum]